MLVGEIYPIENLHTGLGLTFMNNVFWYNGSSWALMGDLVLLGSDDASITMADNFANLQDCSSWCSSFNLEFFLLFLCHFFPHSAFWWTVNGAVRLPFTHLCKSMFGCNILRRIYYHYILKFLCRSKKFVEL